MFGEDIIFTLVNYCHVMCELMVEFVIMMLSNHSCFRLHYIHHFIHSTNTVSTEPNRPHSYVTYPVLSPSSLPNLRQRCKCLFPKPFFIPTIPLRAAVDFDPTLGNMGVVKPDEVFVENILFVFGPGVWWKFMEIVRGR